MRKHVHAPPRLGALRSAGRRVTRQRQLIWEAIALGGHGHVSAQELARELPELHQATVYRTLDVLAAEGLLRRTELGGHAVYELAADHPHHHVVCTSCGRVVHVHDDAVHEARARVAAESGFAVDEDELTFHGLCPQCRRRPLEREGGQRTRRAGLAKDASGATVRSFSPR